MNTLDYIDDYFSSVASLEKKEEFEKKITDDPAFAEEVAFYLSVKQLAKEQSENEKKERFKEHYDQYKRSNPEIAIPKTRIRNLRPYLAAAAMIAVIIIAGTIFFKPVSAEKLAQRYIQDHFQTLGVTMGSRADSLQTGLRLFNEGRLESALTQFESIVTRDDSAFEAKKYAGIVSLRLQHYDKAINYFTQLETFGQVYANPGKFYHGIALLKRGQPGDNQAAKKLMQEVVQDNLDGKETAQRLLDKW